MKFKVHPTQKELHTLYDYIGDEVFSISDLACVGGLKRKSGRTLREHCFIGVKGGKLGYILAYVPGYKGLFSLHRLIWIFHFGEIPKSLVLDHINHTPWDNRISNLRLATCAQNQQNRIKKRIGSSPGIIGVVPSGNGWNAFISNKGKPVYLGRFRTEEEAIEARTEEAKKRYGSFLGEIP